MIALKNVSLRYRSRFVETLALNSIELDVKQGEYISVCGPSGCGKSTLMSVLGLLERPSEGAVLLQGQDTASMGERQRAQLRLKHIGFVFQDSSLIDELTVCENVALPLRYAGLSRRRAREKALETLAGLNLDFRADHYPHQLSGGQRQRVALARAMVKDPALLLADEPTGNLDSTNGALVMETFGALNRQGCTIIMVTHSEEYSACAHRMVAMHDGSLVTGTASSGSARTHPESAAPELAPPELATAAGPAASASIHAF